MLDQVYKGIGAYYEDENSNGTPFVATEKYGFAVTVELENGFYTAFDSTNEKQIELAAFNDQDDVVKYVNNYLETKRPVKTKVKVSFSTPPECNSTYRVCCKDASYIETAIASINREIELAEYGIKSLIDYENMMSEYELDVLSEVKNQHLSYLKRVKELIHDLKDTAEIHEIFGNHIN